MNADKKTKKQLINELIELRKRIAELEKLGKYHEQIEKVLRESEEKYRTAVDFTHDWEYWIDPNGYYIYVSPSCERVTGYNPNEFLSDPNLTTKIAYPDDRAIITRHFSEGLHENADVSNLDFRIITKSGENRWISHYCQPVYGFDGRWLGRRGSNRDISKRKRLEEKLSNLSFRDELTDLYNRRGFLTLAEQQLKMANRLKRGISLVFADLDGMKKINDTLGHKEGDSALIDTSNILKKTFRESDIIARIGGDEFAVLAVETHDVSIEVFIARLKSNLEAHNVEELHHYKLSLSIGFSCYDPDNPCSIEKLLALADTNMYEQKRKKQKDTSFTSNQ